MMKNCVFCPKHKCTYSTKHRTLKSDQYRIFFFQWAIHEMYVCFEGYTGKYNYRLDVKSAEGRPPCRGGGPCRRGGRPVGPAARNGGPANDMASPHRCTSKSKTTISVGFLTILFLKLIFVFGHYHIVAWRPYPLKGGCRELGKHNRGGGVASHAADSASTGWEQNGDIAPNTNIDSSLYTYINNT